MGASYPPPIIQGYPQMNYHVATTHFQAYEQHCCQCCNFRRMPRHDACLSTLGSTVFNVKQTTPIQAQFFKMTRIFTSMQLWDNPYSNTGSLGFMSMSVEHGHVPSLHGTLFTAFGEDRRRVFIIHKKQILIGLKLSSHARAAILCRSGD
jgi:hypothetical protein